MRRFKIYQFIGVTVVALTGALLYHGSVSEAQTKETPAATGTVGKNDTLVYVASGGRQGKGIYVFRLQPQGTEVFQNVTLVPLGLAAETPNPSFLEIDIKHRRLYAVNGVREFEGKPTGAVSAFSIGRDGKLTLLNQRSSMGRGPCHLVLDRESRNLLVANYDSGSVAVFPVAPDGRLGEASDVVQHSGKSINAERQQGPHAHCVTLDPANHVAFVCDLGLDKIMAYRFDAEKGKLTPNDPAFTPITPGSGPRHMAFRPDGRFAYVVNELSSTINAFSYDPEAGRLTELQTVSSLPPYYDGPNAAAEIAVHASGKFLFASNRGNETVVLFAIDPEKGTLTWVEEQGTGGKTPRHFGIAPSGEHMVIGNQDSDTVLASRIDAGNGRLKPSGLFAEVASPVCAQFLPPESEQ
jgi:6-phosphogluconolactonase